MPADSPVSRPSTLLATERSALRPFSGEDADELLGVFRDPHVRRYLLDDQLVSESWMRDEILASERRFARSGAGLWSVRRTQTSPIVGFVGFREFFEPPRLQLLYGLLPEACGRGIATEVAGRVCEYAFRELGMAEVRAAVDLPNEASARVLERLGMRRVHTTDEGLAGTAFFVLEPADRDSVRQRDRSR